MSEVTAIRRPRFVRLPTHPTWRHPLAVIGLAIAATWIVIAIFAPLIAPYDPLAQDFKLIAAPDTLNFGLLIAILLGAAVAVSAAGSGLSLRRFLRV